jgi:hypothetical protein
MHDKNHYMDKSTAKRVPAHTSPVVNQRIREATKRSIEWYAENPRHIPERLRELDREWDIERCVETGFAALTLLGLGLGFSVNRRWLLLSAAVQGFFLQHALQGWCPPIPVLRRLGVRTAQEIESERHALKALIGEYADMATMPGVDRIDHTQQVMAAALP